MCGGFSEEWPKANREERQVKFLKNTAQTAPAGRLTGCNILPADAAACILTKPPHAPVEYCILCYTNQIMPSISGHLCYRTICRTEDGTIV